MSKDVLKEAIKAFDGTAIVVSHDREFLDGLVTKVYEFGGGKVREHLGGIYDFLESRKIQELSELGRNDGPAVVHTDIIQKPQKQDYVQHKEQQKRLRKVERAVEESEKKISEMERRLKELDELFQDPKNASDMVLVTEYTTTKRALDEEVERWEQLSETLEEMSN